MTPQEQQMLQDLTDRVNKTQLAEKDTDAETFLAQTLGRNPESIYILSQTVLVQQYALDQAKKQLNDLKTQLDQARQQAQQPQKHTSFLGSLLGHNDPPPQPLPPPLSFQQTQYAPVPNYAPPTPQFAQPQYGGGYPSQSPFGGQPAQSGGFLRSALTTAAGVAAGAVAFEGIEDLMHGFGHAAGYGSGFSGQGFGGFEQQGRPEEIINNNYYGDSSDRGQTADRGDLSDRVDRTDRLSPDIEDRRGFADTSATDDSDDSGRSDDDSSNDANSFDDSSDQSFDSGGDDSSSSDDSNY